MTSRERNRCETELRGREETQLPSVLLFQHLILSYIIWADKTKIITYPSPSKNALDQTPKVLTITQKKKLTHNKNGRNKYIKWLDTEMMPIVS